MRLEVSNVILTGSRHKFCIHKLRLIFFIWIFVSISKKIECFQNDIFYSPYDLNLVENFVNNLKLVNGDWAKHGIQRIIRLNSDCSQNYVSLRNYRIKADIPLEEAFKDPYTLVEKQIYRKLCALKAKQTNKYVCLDTSTGNFVLKHLKYIDDQCIFFYSTISLNRYTFSIGSNKSISLSFDKNGKLINTLAKQNIRLSNINPSYLRSNFHYQYPNECANKSNVLSIHTKLTDIVVEKYKPIYKIPRASTTTQITTTTQQPVQTSIKYLIKKSYLKNNNQKNKHIDKQSDLQKQKDEQQISNNLIKAMKAKNRASTSTRPPLKIKVRKTMSKQAKIKNEIKRKQSRSKEFTPTTKFDDMVLLKK